jgi:CyaY protein
MALTESEFRSHSDAALDQLNRTLGAASERYDFEVLFQAGVLTLEIEDPNPGKIIISPNGSARQIWISAQMKSFKLDWVNNGFTFGATGESLDALVGRLVGEQLGVGAIQL